MVKMMRVLGVKPLVFLFPSSLHRTTNANTLSSRISFSIPSQTQKQTLAYLSHRRAMAEPASSLPLVRVRDTIELTDVEKKIFDRLTGTLEYFRLPNHLRVAGGWVRDKLLGKECYDIDIALDKMLGRDFVRKIQEYLLSIGEKPQGIAVINSNPDQSKHLETARMRICDMWIDFVNLRSEEYCENSRIPTKQSFGTPEVDAYRRDLTINSLFYNINTKYVEDYTDRGLEDLKCGRIVTPLPPKATFLDDPLRVLRAIRFGARLEFVLDEELKEAASCDAVKTALDAKISRERIGKEIDLMISGNQPVKAMTYISDLTLFDVVFNRPSQYEPAVVEEYDRLCVAYLDATWNLIHKVGGTTFSDEQKRLTLYAAMFLPFRKTTYMDRKSKKGSIVDFFFRESLKGKVTDAETIGRIHSASEKFVTLLPFLALKKDIEHSEVDCSSKNLDIPIASKLRVLAALLLREAKYFWRAALLISTVLYKVESTEDIINKRFKLEELEELYKTAKNSIVELGLEKVWEVKPLVNGKQIMDILRLSTGGPLVREWQEKLLVWQLANPSRTSEECIEWMNQSNSKRAKTETE